MEKRDIWDFEDVKLEPFTLIHDVLVNWWVILLGAIAAALMANIVLTERYEPQYSTSATFAVTSKSNANAYSNLSATYEMAETLQSILQSNTMRKIICEELEVDSVQAQISAEILGQTNLLELRVTAPTSKEATEVIRVVMDNYTRVSYYALGSAVMDVLEEPEVPIYPDNALDVSSSMKKVFVLVAAFLACVFGLLSYLRDTVKREEEIEKKLDARSMGAIPREFKYKTLREFLKHKKNALLVNNPVAGFAFVESYKKMAVKVENQMRKQGLKALVVTSVSENEGKSTVAANLAILLAEQSKKVILIEGDLRRPSQFLIFGADPEENQEIGEYLLGKTKVKNIISKSNIDNLYCILGKNCYSSSTEKVDSKRMSDLLVACKETADYVIIDSPPAGMIGDAEILARIAGAVLVVTKQNYMLAEDVNEVLDAFRAQQAKVVGVVLNKTMSLSGISNTGYYGRYGKYGKYSKYAGSRGNE